MTTSNFIYNDIPDIFSEPQEYKGIKFYPIRIREYRWLEKMYSLLGYPKTFISSNDPNLYKMSYLKFLIFAVPQADLKMKDVSTAKELMDFLRFITRTDNISMDFSGKNTNNFNMMDYKIIIDGVSFSAGEFDDIREIILRQNGTSTKYIEEYDSKFEEKLLWFHRKAGQYNFKEKIFTFAAILGRPISEIGNITIYEMENLFESSVNLLSYSRQTIPLTSVGKDYKFISYMANLKDKGRYDDILISVEKFKKEATYFKSEKDLIKDKIANIKK